MALMRLTKRNDSKEETRKLAWRNVDTEVLEAVTKLREEEEKEGAERWEAI